MNRYELSQKETNILAVLALIFLCAMCSCKKENDPNAGGGTPSGKVKCLFYSTRPTVSYDGVTLKIAGVTVGGLKYSADVPDCSSTAVDSYDLAPGAYSVGYYPYNDNGAASKNVSITVKADNGSCQAFDLK